MKFLMAAFSLLLFVGILMGCSLVNSSGDSLIEYRRVGGIVGFEDYLTIQESGDATLSRRGELHNFKLDSSIMSRVTAAFEASNFRNLEKKYAPSRSMPDSFTYTITYQGYTVIAEDGALPDELQSLIDILNEIIINSGY